MIYFKVVCFLLATVQFEPSIRLFVQNRYHSVKTIQTFFIQTDFFFFFHCRARYNTHDAVAWSAKHETKNRKDDFRFCVRPNDKVHCAIKAVRVTIRSVQRYQASSLPVTRSGGSSAQFLFTFSLVWGCPTNPTFIEHRNSLSHPKDC